MAKNAFNLRKEMLKKSLNKDMMKRITKAIIWSVAETWTYRKEDIWRLEAFEMFFVNQSISLYYYHILYIKRMWVWRKVEKISWRDRSTNEEVLQVA